MKFAVKKTQRQNHIRCMGSPYIKMIEEQLNDELNKYCVECGNENPEYISINNGIFICIECAQNHFKFPKNISKIIKNNIQSLTLNEIQPLLCGGNKALLDFINTEFPKLSEFPPHILYRTEAMIYYRQHLQYLINGGIPPVKPSINIAYTFSNFQNLNYNNILTSENDYYHTIRQERNLLNNNINDIDNYDKFYKSGYNFSRGRKIGRNNMNMNMNMNNMNDINDFDIRFINTINTGEKNYDNYIINKPRQINFQNNNNIIIGNLGNNEEDKIIYSPQKIKIDFKQRNKRTKLNQNKLNNYYNFNNSNSRYTNNANEIYVKPKLILSPKNTNNFPHNEPFVSERTSSVDIIKKNFSENNELLEYGTIISLQNDSKTFNKYFNNNMKYKKMNKNLSQKQFLKSQNTINYIRKNKYIHKSLSQKLINNDSRLLNKNNKNIIFTQTENNKITINNFKNNNKKYINNSSQSQILTRKMPFNNINIKDKIAPNKKVININNEKCFSEENCNIVEVESFPIKINLKKNKKDREISKENKKGILKIKNYFSPNLKIQLDKSEKNENNNNNITIEQKNKFQLINKQNENKNGNIEANLKHLNKKPIKINKHLSQENIMKNSKIIQQKLKEIKIKNNEKINTIKKNK